LILADSSVWIAHFRQPEPMLQSLLDAVEVLMHPMVLGELAMGNLPRRLELLEFLDGLPQALVASGDEVRGLIERERLFALGMGYIDVHLVASVRLTSGARLWSRDRPLFEAAQRFGIASA
jgi:hypothetical protein